MDFEEKRKLTAFFVSAVIAVNTAVIAVNTAAVPAVYAAETGLTGGNEAVTSGISENTALSNNTALSDNTALNSDTTVSTNTNISENTAAGDNTAISENTVSSDTAISSNGASEEDAGEMDNAAQDIPFAALDDETVVENPEPLPEFMTTLTEGNGKQDVTGENTEMNTALKAGQALIRSALNAKETASYISEPVAGASDYAVEYSSKDMGYLPDITINQSPSSLCWAFTASMLAEISLIRKGLIGKADTFSADQTGYFFYNRITDPLGGTEGDKNNLLGNYTYYNRGGNNSFNTWSLASWISERDSSVMPFTGSVYTSVSDDNAYNADAHLQNAYWASMYSAAGNIDYIENVKELIYNYGGVSAIIYSGRSINGNHAVYSTTTTGGHNVTLIGWDDNFSADKFTVTPPGNGAWYVRDSYDGGTNMEEGCYWLSYYDRSLTGPSSAKAIAFDFDKGDNYDNNYQYDGAAGNTTISSSSGRIRVANVFRAKGSEYLEAVGFAPASTEMSYEVDIYKLEEGYSSPINGESLSKTTGETRYVGYRTIGLSEPVALSANDIFSVVITATDTSGNNRAQVYVDMSGTNSNWISFTSSVGEGESYYYNTDLKAYGYNVRIKAYTGNAVGEEKTNKRSYAKAEFNIGEYTYDGTLHTPEVTVKKGADGSGDTLIKGNDYTVSCVNNKYAGTATVQVLSDKYYIRDNIRTFTIKPRQMEQNVTASAYETLYVYDTTAHKPGVKVTDEDLNGSPVTLKENRDYTISYEDNVNAGAARAVITGEGNYTGSVYAGFTVESADIGTCDLEGIEDEVYTGVDITPTINGTFMDTERLENGKDFTVSYSGNINVGTATVAVYGK
ncbi:MAG: hypothetical protein IJ805_08410, partial [Lachnospiraceae bacterium]|nr:hypothetical protein [Lachnospiraceae bacterium]